MHAAEGTFPRQGADLLKTDIMGVFAHPDDETGASATLAAYALGRGKVVANVYCTRGEGGGNMVGTQWGPALGILRETELRDALALIGVRRAFFLDREDFFYTENVAATWIKWDKEETLGRLVRLIRALRPEVIITMNPAPVPGQHGHHQAAAVLATEAFTAAADPARFPGQIRKEGLAVWQTRKLYYTGGGRGVVASIQTGDPLPGGKTPAQAAGAAAAHHRSQAFGDFSSSPRARRPQRFQLVKSVVPYLDSETDLLRGLPASGADADLKPWSLPAPAKIQPGVRLQFESRPAIENYRRWAKEQGVEGVAETLASDLPIVAGEANDVRLQIHNQTDSTAEGEIVLSLPDGWRVAPSRTRYQAQPGATEIVHCRVTPPAGIPADAELTARTSIGGSTTTDSLRLHPVPSLAVRRVSAAPSLDGADTGWKIISATFISPTNLVSGAVRNAADSSAWFRLCHDGQTLFVDVEVTDDLVVTNIAPDDIRGHWRADSVEICVDPEAGAESTVRCFKVGIFPFDTTGVARAARDADANQGLIEETAPGMRVVSRRTPAGYRIQAAIPFRDIGVLPLQGKRLGFNIIVYDGDKAGAALGENINKSRIAWAPRAGVQGRPEDWGRIDF